MDPITNVKPHIDGKISSSAQNTCLFLICDLTPSTPLRAEKCTTQVHFSLLPHKVGAQ
jgi:hypothetical protein